MAAVELISPAISALASFAGAWIAARLALSHFYRERIWERRAAAYTAIFAALHDIEKWYEKHYDAYISSRELDDAKKQSLSEAANAAENDLEKRLASETWLVPERSQERLRKLTETLKSYSGAEWFEYLDSGCAALAAATTDLRKMAQTDLRIKDSNALWRFLNDDAR